MRYIADLHIHSPYSRATSKSSHLSGLAAWAAVKGIHVVGTGDFTHPGWFGQITETLEEAEPGFFRLKQDRGHAYADVLPSGLQPEVEGIRFVLTAEISSIYKRGGKVRKVHNILFAPDLDSVRRINATLAGIGNVESDGRPILGLDSRNLLEIVLEKAPEGFLVPAHIWTPWFSLFGSKSGFDTIEECFADLAPYVFALETGLSSDPDMNRMISALDRFSLVSNSDCHSPAKLGREANIFTTDFDFFAMRDALRHPVDETGRQRFAATIEFYPEEGKYHCDGHRKCAVSLEPMETHKLKGVCPVCGRPVTVGVLNRVMELADRDQPVYPPGAPGVHSLVPLPELLGELLNVGPGTKKVTQHYVKLIQRFGSEFSLLLDAETEAIERATSAVLAEAVARVRAGQVIRKAGYDGEFGVIKVFTDQERNSFGGQQHLFGTDTAPVPRAKARRRINSRAGVRSVKTTGSEKHSLNPEQQKAVGSDARFIVVKAGPGTGKTHTLVQRVVRMVSDGARNCTVITFTNRAADELSSRFGTMAAEGGPVFVATFHGYCLHWLRLREPELRVIGPDMRRSLLRLIYPRHKADDIARLAAEISAFLLAGHDPGGMVPHAMELYFSRLAREKLLDIDAILPSAVTLLRQGDELAGEMRQATGKLFIDEFQDLNQSQYELVRLLAATQPVFAIGDPDQAIYGFRGSSPVWFFEFVRDLVPAQYQLYRNYRSASAIVAAAGAVIANNSQHHFTVCSESVTGRTGTIHVSRTGSANAEATFIVRQIEKLVGGTSHREIDRMNSPREKSVSLGDIAVLYRTGRQADIIARSLTEHGFPVQVVDLVPFYMSGPLHRLYLWVMLAAGHAEPIDVLQLLKGEGGIGKVTLAEAEQAVATVTRNPLGYLLEHRKRFSPRLQSVLQGVADLQEEIQSTALSTGVIEALRPVIEKYGADLQEDELARFVSLAANYGSSLDDFATHLRRYADTVVYDDRAEAITLMTLHASKGLEFNVVFIAGAEEGLIPLHPRGTLSPEEEARHLEEERRLFYVGMTRAEELLHILYAENRTVDGQVCDRQPSRFLAELPLSRITPVINDKGKKRNPTKGRQLPLFK